MILKRLFERPGRTDVFELGERRLAQLQEEGRYSCYRSTRATLRKLSLFLNGRRMPADKVTPTLVADFQDYLLHKVGNSRSTAGENIKVLSLLLDAAGVRKNPCASVAKGREERTRSYLTEEELERMMALRLKPGSEMAVARDLFFMECRTGLRISDLLQLRWEAYDGASLHLRMQKTRRSVTVPVTNGVRTVLERYRDLFSSAGGYIFPTLRCVTPCADTFSHAKSLISATGRVNRQIKGLARRAGVEKRISTHTGRHTFATMLISHGASIYEVKELLGHSDVKVTQVYAHLADSRKRALVAMLE